MDEVIAEWGTPDLVVSGGARGIDRLADAWATARGYVSLVMPADWDRHGKSAGYKRNQEMVERTDRVIAIWDGRSPGTKHTIDIARKAGKRVTVFTVKG